MNYNKKTVTDIDVAGKKVLLRCDFNVPMAKDGSGVITDKSKGTVPCTSCRYCMSKCPQELEIPKLLGLYNEHAYSGGDGFIAPMVIGTLDEDKRPSACIGCGACAAVCPQQIDIPGTMSKFAGMLAKGE